MVQPPAGHAKGKDEPRPDGSQALVQISRLLLVNPVQARGPQPEARGVADGIEIADNRNRLRPVAQRAICPTVGRYQHGRMFQRQPQRRAIHRAARNQCDPCIRDDKMPVHTRIVPELWRETDVGAIINPSNYPHLSMESNRAKVKSTQRQQRANTP